VKRARVKRRPLWQGTESASRAERGRTNDERQAWADGRHPQQLTHSSPATQTHTCVPQLGEGSRPSWPRVLSTSTAPLPLLGWAFCLPVRCVCLLLIHPFIRSDCSTRPVERLNIKSLFSTERRDTTQVLKLLNSALIDCPSFLRLLLLFPPSTR